MKLKKQFVTRVNARELLACGTISRELDFSLWDSDSPEPQHSPPLKEKKNGVTAGGGRMWESTLGVESGSMVGDGGGSRVGLGGEGGVTVDIYLFIYTIPYIYK
jgi:hypothetical protein